MDLALELRMRLGDWFRVVQLVQSGALVIGWCAARAASVWVAARCDP